jgi:hypothetical protein
MLLLFVSSFALAQSSAHVSGKLYAVVFQVSVNSSGKVEALKIAKVIDPSSGTTNPVYVPVPQSYIAAVRVFLAKRSYVSTPKQFFTYTFYDPSQPGRADIDPKAGRL